MANVFAGVGFDGCGLVEFGLNSKELTALFIFKDDLVGGRGRALRSAASDDAAPGLMVGQLAGWHVVSVVYAASDNRLVGVAFEEVHNDFLADAGNEDGAPVGAGPRLGDADEAGGVFIVFAFAVPMELDFHAAEFIGKNLLTFWTDHDGGLRALHERAGSGAQRPKLDSDRDAGKGIGVARTGTAGIGDSGALEGRVSAGREDISAVLIATLTFGDGKTEAGGKGTGGADTPDNAVG